MRKLKEIDPEKIELDLKSRFLKEVGVDLTDFEYTGKFPSRNKHGVWGNIPRGQGYKRYSEWLESRIKELEEENKRLETEIKVISVDDQQEISKLKKENEEFRKYTNHIKKCQLYHQGGTKCTCGLDKLLEK